MQSTLKQPYINHSVYLVFGLGLLKSVEAAPIRRATSTSFNLGALIFGVILAGWILIAIIYIFSILSIIWPKIVRIFRPSPATIIVHSEPRTLQITHRSQQIESPVRNDGSTSPETRITPFATNLTATLPALPAYARVALHGSTTTVRAEPLPAWTAYDLNTPADVRLGNYPYGVRMDDEVSMTHPMERPPTYTMTSRA